MNKIISTSLLLLAGTALSQAASIASSFFTGSTSETYQMTYNALNNSSGVSALFDSSASDFSASVYTNIVNDGALSAGVWYFTSKGNGSYSSGAAVIPYVSGGYGTTIAHGIGSSGYGYGAVSYVYNTISASELANVTSLSLDFTISGISSSAVTSIDVAVFYVDSTNAVYRIALSTALTDGTYSISLGLDNVDTSSDGTFVVAFEGNGTAWTSAQGESAATISNLTFTAVPEPSAFGLLAGIGALALVAARRRRSRKAA